MMRRSRAREVALQMLFQWDLNPEVDLNDVHEMIQEWLPDHKTAEFAWLLVRQVQKMRKELDERIEQIAQNWTLKRMSPVDRNILRLGACELLTCDTPYQVVIDEAVELAKRYGAEQSPQFVNGILDRLVPPERRCNASPKSPPAASETSPLS